MMELLALIGFVVVVAAIVVGVNLYKRPDWTKRKLGSLTERFK
jgi:hypothetical protein